MSSIFTKILRGELPCHKIDETDDCFAFLDINPNSKGHTLCILKKEIDYIFDLSSEDYQKLMNFSRKIAIALKKSVNCKRIALSVVGLEVPHVHVHLIPLESMSDMNFGRSIKLDDNEFKSIVEKIKSNLK
ncbi:HIT family protein [Flavobacteriales bacterium]|nr:HIT family protein [Flavobacteriales bacterium]GIR97680.1 MAG: hydrolase [Flavobacteriaceae bacterium]